MADLVVNTDALWAAGRQLRGIVAIAESLGEGGRMRALVPAVGRPGAAQAVTAFGDASLYGVGWIGAQAGELSRRYLLAGAAYAGAEARLTAAAGGPAATVEVPFEASGGPAPDPVRPNWAALAPVAGVPVQLGSATAVTQLVPGDPEQVRALARALTGFAEELAGACSACRQVSDGGWVGAAADAVAEQTHLLLTRLCGPRPRSAKPGAR